MKKLLFRRQIIVVLVSLMIVHEGIGQTFNPNLALKLDSTLISFVPSQVKGVSAGVYVPGQGVWRGTYGVSYAGHPITSDMEFGIASNTKLFVAAAMMKLVENNIISLNDHIGKWIKKKYTNIDSTISIKQLLYHTSGLADNSIEFFDTAIKYPNRAFTVEEVLGWQDPKVASPGVLFNYSNTNYMLAGLIAEKATGIHISKLIRDSILTPAHLDSTFFSYKELVLGTIAHPWVSGVDDSANTRIALNSISGACGAIYSTAPDMVKWYNALLSCQIVNASSVAQMTTFLTGQYQFGFGLQKRIVLGRTTWGHGGKTLGYLSEAFYDPITRVSAFGISNSDSASVTATTFLLLKTAADCLPDTAQVITGITTACQGQVNVTYTVSPIARATSYKWILPSGVTGTSSTNSITVNFGNNAVSGNIIVSGSNMYGEGLSARLSVNVKNSSASAVNIAICNSQVPYSWNGNNYSNSGSYTIHLTNSIGCDSAATLHLVVYQPTGSNAVVSTCGNYTWNGTTYTTSGIYTKTLTNAHGCDSTATLTLTIISSAIPSVTVIPAAAAVCSGSMASFLAQPVNGGNAPSYQWKLNGVNAGTDNPAYNVSTLADNDSVWCVMTSNATCVTTNTAFSNKVKMTVKSTPAIGVSAIVPAVMCTIGSTRNVSNSNTNGGGVWSSSDNSIVTVNTIAGANGIVMAQGNGVATLTYTKTAANGCAATAGASVMVDAVPAINLIQGVSTMCKGTLATMSTATNGGIWGSLNNYATVNSGGVVSAISAGAAVIVYTVTNASGCSAGAAKNIIISNIPAVPGIAYAAGSINPQAGAGGASNFCNNKGFTLAGLPAGGAWSSTGGVSIHPATGAATTNALGAASVTYSITNGACSNSRSIVGIVVACAARDVNTNQPITQLTNQQFTMYPNPATTFICINVETLIGAGSVVITNLYGKQVKQQPLSMGNNTLDVSSLAKGMYLVSVITVNGKKTGKLVVQ